MKQLSLSLLNVFILSLACGCASPNVNADTAKSLKSVADSNIPIKVFEQFWQTSEINIYPKNLEQKFFTATEYDRLKKITESSSNIYELAPALNDFLKKLKVSHTHFYTDRDLEFYFFRSLFTTRDLDKPALNHIGAEYELTQNGYVIRSVLDGFAAHQSGLRRGDLIIDVDRKPFDPVSGFSNSKDSEIKISVKRADKTLQVGLKPTFTGLHRAYIEAIKNSVKTINVKNKKIGYVHLWTGTHDESVKALNDAVDKLIDTDALILDLRDGYGGAWWNHLDPFFSHSQDYFKATWVDRDGKKTEMAPEIKKNPKAYLKPMVVLINEGVRSAKEALAFQFKKSKRATLVGTRTAGFFVGGGAYFREPELPYFLYLSSKGLFLDGQDIECKGVRPDVFVRYSLSSSQQADPQLTKALEILTKIRD